MNSFNKKVFISTVLSFCICQSAFADATTLEVADVLDNGGASIVDVVGDITITPAVQAVTDIQWAKFNIAGAQTVDFAMTMANQTVINRVDAAGGVSNILGNITQSGGFAGGHIFLINPNGILFGPASTINLNSFTASTIPMSVNDLGVDSSITFDEAVSSMSGILIKNGAVINIAADLVLLSNAIKNEADLDTAPIGQSKNFIVGKGAKFYYDANNRFDSANFNEDGTQNPGEGYMIMHGVALANNANDVTLPDATTTTFGSFETSGEIKGDSVNIISHINKDLIGANQIVNLDDIITANMAAGDLNIYVENDHTSGSTTSITQNQTGRNINITAEDIIINANVASSNLRFDAFNDVTFNANDVTINAIGDDSRITIGPQNNVTFNANDIDINATGDDTSIRIDPENDIIINANDITLNSSGNNTDGLNGGSLIIFRSRFLGGNTTVTANDVLMNATGSDSYAYISSSKSLTMNVNDITMNSSGVDFDGNFGGSLVQIDSDENATITANNININAIGDETESRIFGCKNLTMNANDIDINATGDESSAYIKALDDITVIANDINIDAIGDDSNAYIIADELMTMNVHDLTMTSSGLNNTNIPNNYGSAAYIESTNNNATITANNIVMNATNTDSRAYFKIDQDLNLTANNIELNAITSMSDTSIYSGNDIDLTANNIKLNAPGLWADAYIASMNNLDLTANNIDINAVGDISSAFIFAVTQDLNITANDIIMNALGDDSVAYIKSAELMTMKVNDITMNSSGADCPISPVYINSFAYIESTNNNATITANDITMNATNTKSQAYIDADQDLNITANDITASATGLNSRVRLESTNSDNTINAANVEINATGDNSFAFVNSGATTNITSESLDINATGDFTTINLNPTVDMNITSDNININAGNFGLINIRPTGNMDITSNNISLNASSNNADINITSADMDITSDQINIDASGNFSGASFMSTNDMNIASDYINMNASGNFSNAEFYSNGNTDIVSKNITTNASGDNTTIRLYSSDNMNITSDYLNMKSSGNAAKAYTFSANDMTLNTDYVNLNFAVGVSDSYIKSFNTDIDLTAKRIKFNGINHTEPQILKTSKALIFAADANNYITASGFLNIIMLPDYLNVNPSNQSISDVLVRLGKDDFTANNTVEEMRITSDTPSYWQSDEDTYLQVLHNKKYVDVDLNLRNNQLDFSEVPINFEPSVVGIRENI